MAMTTQAKSSLSMRSPTLVQGVLDVDAEPLLDQRAPELAGHRLVALAHDGVDGLGQRQTGLEAARHQAEGLGELGVEGAEPPAVPALEVRATGATAPSEQAEDAP